MKLSLTRRQMLRLAGSAAAGALVARRGWASSLRKGRPLPPLRQLRQHRPEPGLIEAELVAVPRTVGAGGVRAELWTYQGSFPGPLLRMREGDHVRLWFTNGLQEETNLHLHGLHLSPDVDNPFLSVAPGDAHLYEFDVPAGSRGLHWYHPHVHGHVARQLFAGLAGPILVDGDGDPVELEHADDRVVVLKDLSIRDGAPEPHSLIDWRRGKEGDLLLVNGALDPELLATRGALRLRFLNASNARYYRLALEDHVLHLIATDGHPLAEPLPVDEILLAPGERVEVLVTLDRPGRFALLDLPYDRGAGMMGMGGMGPSGTGPDRSPVRLMTVVRLASRTPQALPSSLGTPEDYRDREPDVTRRLVLAEGMMGAGFTIDGRTFDPDRVDLTAKVDSVEVWEIENRGMMDHPFHLHTYPFQVLSTDGVPAISVVWKDVVNVRRGGSVRIAVPLRDVAGRTVYHCHIVEHEDRGMMGTLEVTPG